MPYVNRSLLTATAALLLAACATPAATTTTPTAPASGFPDFSSEIVTPDFSADGIAALEARMAQFVEDGHTKGIATVLIKDGQVISHVQAGIRDAETGAPITEDTIYRIYSMTKPVTAVAMMKLVEDGKLTLDDPVTKFIPEFEGLKVVKDYTAEGSYTLVDADRPPTIRELMTHTAGFGYGLFGDDPSNKAFRDGQVMRSPDLETFIDAVAEIPLIAQPGTKWAYSASVDIQGAIIERVSGQTLGTFFQTEIFAPLGMDDTGFYVPAEDYARFSDVFGYDPESGALVPVPYPQVAFRKETIGMESGGGGLVSTLGDYARFAQMLAGEGALGEARILSPESVKLIHTNALPDGVTVDTSGRLTRLNDPTMSFGLNVGVFTDNAAKGSPYGEETFFWGGAAGTWFWVDPVNDIAFVGMIQRFGQNAPVKVDFGQTAQDHVYDAFIQE